MYVTSQVSTCVGIVGSGNCNYDKTMTLGYETREMLMDLTG